LVHEQYQSDVSLLLELKAIFVHLLFLGIISVFPFWSTSITVFRTVHTFIWGWSFEKVRPLLGTLCQQWLHSIWIMPFDKAQNAVLTTGYFNNTMRIVSKL